MTGICTSLETDNDIRLFSKGVSDLSLSFITPVYANNCFYHVFFLS